MFVDGLSAKEICEFRVPDRTSYSSDKAKLQANGSCVGKLLNVAKRAEQGTMGANLDPVAALKHVMTSYDTNEDTALIIYGSPLYDDAKEAAFSMSDSYVPTEGHIIAERGKSPFSLVGFENGLAGARTVWITPASDWALNSDHAEQVKAHWFKSMIYAGAKPLTLSHDRDSSLRLVMSKTARTVAVDEIVNDKIEMVQVVSPVRSDIAIHERRLSTRALSDHILFDARDIEVGITWDCGACDVDLHVTPRTRAQTLYYGHKRSDLGRFHKDYTSGRSLSNGLERVTLPGPLDLSDMAIQVRHYSGLAPRGIRGELRIAIGAETFAKRFELSPTANGRARAIDIDPISVVR